MQEMQVPSLGQEDPLEEEMSTCSSILAWRIPQTEEPGGLQSMGLQRVWHDWATEQLSMHATHTYGVCVLSHFSRVWLLEILWTVACQPPLSIGFSRQEYWREIDEASLLNRVFSQLSSEQGLNLDLQCLSLPGLPLARVLLCQFIEKSPTFAV